MKTSIEIYTSYYAFMKKMEKGIDDIYIQVSRTRPFWFKVDQNEGEELGNYGALEDYTDELDKEYIEYFVETSLRPTNYECIGSKLRIFLLCYENTDCKPCHRTLLAEHLNQKYNLNIKEYR